MVKNYIDGKSFLKEMTACKENGALSSKALEYYGKIIVGVSRKFSYVNPADRQDAHQQAYLKFLMYWHNFDPEKNQNAFAYYTQIAKMAFAESFNKNNQRNGNNVNVRFVSLDDLNFDRDAI